MNRRRFFGLMAAAPVAAVAAKSASAPVNGAQGSHGYMDPTLRDQLAAFVSSASADQPGEP